MISDKVVHCQVLSITRAVRIKSYRTKALRNKVLGTKALRTKASQLGYSNLLQ